MIRESEGPVGGGEPLLEIGDPAALEIAVDVLTTEAVSIRPGARVTIKHWGGSEDLEGRVRLVEPGAFTKVSALGVEEQRVWVVIDLVSPHDRWATLGDGFRVDAAIVTEERSTTRFLCRRVRCFVATEAGPSSLSGMAWRASSASRLEAAAQSWRRSPRDWPPETRWWCFLRARWAKVQRSSRKPRGIAAPRGKTPDWIDLARD